MLQKIEIKNFVYTDVPEKVVPIIRDIENRIIRGEKIAIKKKTTKSAVYLNVYEYDKTCWKYLLTQSIQIG